MKLLWETPLHITHERMNARTYRERVERPRSKGVHVQEINKRLAIGAGKMDAVSTFEGFDEANYPLLPALGLAWEDLWASLYSESELSWQPNELERDGIFGTPDALFYAFDWPVIGECKLTTGKIKPVTESYMYMKQGLAYCAQTGMRHVLYEVMWILGDYMRPYQPKATSSMVEFRDDEVETWWGIMKREAEKMRHG